MYTNVASAYSVYPRISDVEQNTGDRRDKEISQEKEMTEELKLLAVLYYIFVYFQNS